MVADYQRYNGSKWLCRECGAVYDSAGLNINAERNAYGYMACPKSDCDGELVEIDELMIPTIQILNQKGYFTEYCCSGHYTSYDCHTYIKFADGIDIPSVPHGFNKDKDGKHVVIESHISFGKPGLTGFYKICDNAKILAKWAYSLHSIYETEF